MQFLIFSDSHGNHFPMVNVIRQHPDITNVLFLGDGLADVERLFAMFPQHVFRCVRGNMDFFIMREAEDTDLFTLFGCRVMMMHGHLAGVKSSTAVAEKRACEAGARVLLYGHTHRPECRYLSDEGLYVFNPGSIGRPYDGKPSYGLMDVLPDGSVMLSHGEVK